MDAAGARLSATSLRWRWFLVALHETASHLRRAADVLDPPDPSTYMSPVHLRSLLPSAAAAMVAITVVGLTLSGFTMAVVAGSP